MRTSIAAKLYVGFGLMAALIVGGAGFMLYSMNQSTNNYAALYQSTKGAVLLANAQNALWQLRYGFPQFMVMDPAARATIVADESKWYKQVDGALDAYTALDLTSDERQGLAKLRENYKRYIEARPLWFELYGSGKIQEAADWRAKTTTPFGKATVASINDLIALQQKASLATEEASAAGAATIQKAVVVFILLSLLAAALIAYATTRSLVAPLTQLIAATERISKGDFTGRGELDRKDELGILARAFNRTVEELTSLIGAVQKSSIQVNTSVTGIAASSKQQQATAGEIASTTTEIGATSKEISATSRELVRTMGEIAEVADQSAILAGSGKAGLSQMEQTIRHVMDAAASINAKLAVLSEKAGNINQVVTTITKVADQTNLLSLNAAIEAEKAGEFGRGFGVVATEIRRLADQTVGATYDIEQMVKEIQSAVSAGVMGMDKFSEEVRHGMQEVQQVGTQLSQIIEQVQALAPRFEAVFEGVRAQSTGAEQISQTLTQLSEAAQQIVDSLRQSDQAIDGLHEAAGGLRSGVSRFKLVEA